MTLDLTQLAKETFTDFSGGLNEDVSSYNVADNQVIAAKNVRFSSTGEITTRLGERNYGPGSSGIVQPVRGMHRYVNSDGTRAFFMYSGTQTAGVDRTGVVYIDDDAGTLTEKTTLLTNDGYLRFTQFKDALFMGTDRFGQRAIYAKQTGDDLWFNPSWAVGVGIEPFTATSIAGTNSFQVYTNYFYRYTYDIHIGGTFLFETGPSFRNIHDQFGQFSPRYIQDVFSPTDATTVFNFNKRNAPSIVANIDQTLGGATIKRINIYRRQGLLNETDLTTESLQFADFFFIGSVDAVDFDAAVSGDTMFTDDGIAPGIAITHGGLIWPPYARFSAFHKGRMWLAHTTVVPNDKSAGPYTDANLEYEPSRIYYSEFGARKSQPLTYLPFSYTDIAASDGEPITGIVSAKDDVLLVFKPNSIWAIRGGDGFIGESTKPSIRVTNVSTNIGCIAPETILQVDEGIVFLSNSGVYIVDGNRGPFPMDERKVRNNVVNATPGRKYNAASGYDAKEKDIWIAYTSPDTGGQYNRSVNLFSKLNRNWTRYELPIGAGVSVFSNKQSINEEAKFFAGRDDNLGSVLLQTPLVQLASSFADRAGAAISWSFQTKFYDLGLPFMNKDFQYVLFHVKSITALTLHIVCDNRIDTQTDAGGGFTIPIPTETDALIWNVAPSVTIGDLGDDNGTGWGANNWALNREGLSLVRLDDRIWGHRISFIVSGTNRTDPVTIQALTVFYKQKEGVRFR